MSFDIHGNPLRRGHCEVHPHVHEEYPCSVCMSENRMRHQQEMQQCCDGNPSHCESAHYLGLAQEEIKSLKSERDALSAVVERQREALNDLLSADEQAEGYGVAGVADDIRDKVRDVLALTPETALRLHEADLLEWCAKQYDQVPGREVFCSTIAQELRDHAAFIRSGKKAVDYGLCDGVCDD